MSTGFEAEMPCALLVCFKLHGQHMWSLAVMHVCILSALQELHPLLQHTRRCISRAARALGAALSPGGQGQPGAAFLGQLRPHAFWQMAAMQDALHSCKALSPALCQAAMPLGRGRTAKISCEEFLKLGTHVRKAIF
jgi:hypothetical protein